MLTALLGECGLYSSVEILVLKQKSVVRRKIANE